MSRSAPLPMTWRTPLTALLVLLLWGCAPDAGNDTAAETPDPEKTPAAAPETGEPEAASDPAPADTAPSGEGTEETGANEEPSGLLGAFERATSDPIPEEIDALALHDKMEQVDETYFNVEQGIKKKDHEQAVDYLGQLVHLFRSAREEKGEQRFVDFTDGMLEKLGEAAKAVDGGDAMTIRKALVDVGAQCKACHEVYKKKKKKKK